MSDEQPPYGARRVSGGYRLDVPRWVLLGILQRHLGPYSREAALISYRLDVDAGTVKSIREYARIWDWTKKKVEKELPGIRDEVASWGGIGPEQGAARAGTKRGQIGDRSGTKGGDSSEDSPNVGTDRGQIGDRSGTHTIQPTTHRKNGGVGNARAREGPSAGTNETTEGRGVIEVDPFNPANGYPQREDVIAFAIRHGATAELAEELFSSFTAAGWKNRHGTPYEHWGHAIISAIRYRGRSRNGHGSHQPAPRTESSYERRMRGVDRDELERDLAAIRGGHVDIAAPKPAAGRDPDLDGRSPV